MSNRRIYPEKGYTIVKRFSWNKGKNFVNIPIEELSWVRLSANNGLLNRPEGSICNIEKIRKFKTVHPHLDESNGKILAYSDPGFAPHPELSLSDDLLASMLKDCQGTMFEKLKDFKNNFNSFSFIAERKQTINMVGERLISLYKVLKIARKPLLLLEAKAARHPNNISIRKQLADKRLEYSFGWAPLMGDIHAACHAFPPPVEIALRTSRQSSHYYQSESSVSKTLMSGTFKVTTKAILEMDGPAVASASSLGLDNPSLVAWELTPWTLVVDWFVPIGSYIENLTALNGFSVNDAGTTLGARGVGTMNAIGTKSYATTIYRMQSRIPFTFDNPIPTLQNPFSINRVLNSLALISQLRK